MAIDDVVNETMKEKKERIMITGDYHIPFQDNKAVDIMLQFARDYKPNHFVINGDLMDFYGISKFDKNPERSGQTSLQQEIDKANDILDKIKKALPIYCKIYFADGNHQNRLQRYLWSNTELFGLEVLMVENFLRLKERGIKYVTESGDYWKTATGHLLLGDVVVQHGDNRLNGASMSQYSGYSAKNTMSRMNMSTCMNHTHRGAVVYHTTPYVRLVGMEAGCLCQKTGTADWQQGFITFEVENKKSYNHKFHLIEKGKLIEDKTYSSSAKNPKL